MHNLCISKGFDLQDNLPHELDACWLIVHLGLCLRDIYVSNSTHLNLPLIYRNLFTTQNPYDSKKTPFPGNLN